jgi:hypothetical protein
VEVLVDGAERYLALKDRQGLHSGFNAKTAERLDAKTFDAKTFDAKTFDERLLRPCPTKFVCGYCCARSIGWAMRGRQNSARSKPCCRHWTEPAPRTMQGADQG